MSVEVLGVIFQFAGGLGMFLYGMNIMGDGLQKAAGNKMHNFLGKITSNRFLGLLAGALITAIIQSSSATTVMVVGFVNAGLLDLGQAAGVIMGANIGTTITSWIVSMNEWEWAAVLKPSFFAPLLIAIGAFFIMLNKSQKRKEAGQILSGFGILFIGLEFMTSSIEPYSASPVFSAAFRILGRNPVFGILTGLVVTAFIQSSSASVGILQALAANGVVGWNSAVYITLGQNMGTCVTALISSTGANRTAKRAAVMHFLFNLMGAIIFGVLMSFLFLWRPVLAEAKVSSVDISVFHTIFNIANTLILFPFGNLLVKLSGVIVKDHAHNVIDDELESMKRHLDERILETPSFALDNAIKQVVHMGEITMENVKRSVKALLEKDGQLVKEVMEQEKLIDQMEKILTEYLVKISNLSLSEKQQLIVNHMFYTIINFERVGDHAENIGELASITIDRKLQFTEEAYMEMENMCKAAIESFENSLLSRSTEDQEYIRKVVKCEELVDNLEEEYREHHIARLSKNVCNSETGVVFVDLLVNLERISDHSMNIANFLLDELD
ncbi:Na/Pi cotransporter family protein [[Clostridium] polysaccharolyticum]|uniref:Phosphate:Na+ symporter n=1 Tax=[Clostridium] polysaccharolyticum TaxID=29364 RepID=A0A1I0BCU2_9FIRM|nr:Na/Pi cotransporter family protein [[Clostridium] polysaccharolyticum]SET04323.1 phosphate:Na+ symporter [[Clostridium] polysaccharolyticum]